MSRLSRDLAQVLERGSHHPTFTPVEQDRGTSLLKGTVYEPGGHRRELTLTAVGQVTGEAPHLFVLPRFKEDPPS